MEKEILEVLDYGFTPDQINHSLENKRIDLFKKQEKNNYIEYC